MSAIQSLYKKQIGATETPLQEPPSPLTKIELIAANPVQWNERAVSHLKTLEEQIDAQIPDCLIQKKADEVASYISQELAPLNEFNCWLDSNGKGPWAAQLAVYLAKLPFRVVRNIVRALYETLSSILYAGVHPLKALNHFAQNLILFLSRPEEWAQLGAKIFGASLGAACLATPIPVVIGLAAGGALMIAGVAATGISCILKQKTEKEPFAQFDKTVSLLPESILTGFCLGFTAAKIKLACEPGVQQPKPFQMRDWDWYGHVDIYPLPFPISY